MSKLDSLGILKKQSVNIDTFYYYVLHEYYIYEVSNVQKVFTKKYDDKYIVNNTITGNVKYFTIEELKTFVRNKKMESLL